MLQKRRHPRSKFRDLEDGQETPKSLRKGSSIVYIQVGQLEMSFNKLSEDKNYEKGVLHWFG